METISKTKLFNYIISHKYSSELFVIEGERNKEAYIASLLTFIQFRVEELRGDAASLCVGVLGAMFLGIVGTNFKKKDGNILAENSSVIDVYLEREFRCGSNYKDFMSKMKKRIDLKLLDKEILSLTPQDLNL